MEAKTFDNVQEIVRDDLANTIQKGSKVSIAAAFFSMYAYRELKEQLESIEEFQFIFTSPTFIKDKEEKQKREFYIPRIQRESSLYGTEFEIKLRNEMTQKAIAKECADWIRKKATFKSNATTQYIQGLMTVTNEEHQYLYSPIFSFTTVDIGCEHGNNTFNLVTRFEGAAAQQYFEKFEELWHDSEKLQNVTETVVDMISNAYQENSPEFYLLYDLISCIQRVFRGYF